MKSDSEYFPLEGKLRVYRRWTGECSYQASGFWIERGAAAQELR